MSRGAERDEWDPRVAPALHRPGSLFGEERDGGRELGPALWGLAQRERPAARWPSERAVPSIVGAKLKVARAACGAAPERDAFEGVESHLHDTRVSRVAARMTKDVGP